MKRLIKQYRFFSLLIIAIFIINQLQGQMIYQTSKGHLLISVVTSDFIIQKHFDKLRLSLNYENARLSWIIDDVTSEAISETIHPKSKDINENLLKTENENFNDNILLSVFGTPSIEFIGELNIDFIKTTSHPPQQFNIEGILTMGKIRKQVKGIGLITHIEAGQFACMLEVTFPSLIINSNYDGNIQSYEIKFQILQSILNNHKLN